MLKQEMVNLDQVQTQVISQGRWIEDDPLPGASKHIVIVIPGNPGIPRFYQDFIKAIKTRLSLDLPIWIVGYPGHTEPFEDLNFAMLSNEEWHQCYSLVAQIQHKINFIKKFVPEDAKLHLVGHSIGSWIILNLLKDPEVAKRIEKCYLLFPAIEHMAESHNGIKFRTFVFHLMPLFMIFSWIFTIFPLNLQTWLVRIFGWMLYDIPERFVGVIRGMLHPTLAYRMIRLVKCSMRNVGEADHDTISKNIDKLWIYYGVNDNWVPINAYMNMKLKHPKLNVNLCQRGIKHAFVLKNDTDMGEIVGDLINENCLRDSEP